MSANADRWAPWRFLIGDWRGTGGGAPGEAASGATSFRLELARQVLARRGSASYAATAERPAFTHEDLMYVYPDGTGWRALYLDSEGHAIAYRATADGARATFESDPDAQGMRYRLRYEADASGVGVVFEVAPPGQDYAVYVTGRLVRT
jgi:hypothetical protein